MQHKTEEQKKQVINLVEKLLTCDNAKNLLSNITDMYVSFNQTDFADCQADRKSKAGTFLYLTDFFGGLKNLKA